MRLQVPDHWVWDCWVSDDGECYHLFFLKVPSSIGDTTKRHLAAVGMAGIGTNYARVRWSIRRRRPIG
jgi:hypothetical protein